MDHQDALNQLGLAFSNIPFNRMLGTQLETLSAQETIIHFDMKETLIGNFLYGILHGGVISSVLDMAGGMVVMANALHRYQDRPLKEIMDILGKCSTVDLQISYLSPGRGDTFIAKATLTKGGQTLSFTRMELLNQDQTLLATATGTYLVKG